MAQEIKTGVIGYGYWGPNIVRNFCASDNIKVSKVCDLSEYNLVRVKKYHPHIETCTNYLDITKDKNIDAVAIITPVYTHYDLAKSALMNGKHIFVEKPFTASSAQAEELIELADKKNLTIMVDHTFLFTGAVRTIKDYLSKNLLGNLYYYDSTRINLGLIQSDINVVWDLAPHDLSIMDYVIDHKPIGISATGIDHFGRNIDNIAYITILFENNLIAHLNLNWLSPVKIRSTVISGEEKMLVWNDVEADEKIKIYDKGVEIKSKDDVYNLLVSYRKGDMVCPHIPNTEALAIETDYFAECIFNGTQAINNGIAGLRIVKMLEAASKSIKQRGAFIEL